MFLISLTLKFETKILDIAYLLLLKLMKEPNFQIDFKYIQLYLKVLIKQGKNKETHSRLSNAAGGHIYIGTSTMQLP